MSIHRRPSACIVIVTWVGLAALAGAQSRPAQSTSQPVSTGPTWGTRLDLGLADAQRPQPVFVRMADQLLSGAGSYAAFCERNSNRKRGELRVAVRNDLRERKKLAQRARATRAGTGAASAHGVPFVPQRGDQDPGAGRSHRTQDRAPTPGLEPMAASVLPERRRPAPSTPLGSSS